MKRFFACGVLAIFILASAPHAFAQNSYFSGFVGAGSHPDATTAVAGVGTFDFNVDTGVVVGGAVGIELDNNFRFEGELALHTSSIDDPQFFAPGASLDIDVYSFMVNGYYDFDLNGPVTPYVGVGAGFGIISAEGETAFGVLDNDSDLELAYQLMAGFAFDLSPRTSVTVGYRYFGTTDPEVTTFGFNFDTEFQSHEFVAGVLFRF